MMILRMLSLISIIAFGLCVAEELTFPANTCHQDAADYSTCLKDAAQEAWPRIAQGLPEFNFPTMDPLFYERHHATYNAGEVRADIDVTNITMTGLKDIRFTSVKAHFLDKDVFRLEVDFLMPNAFTVGTIKTIGSVGPFRLNSTGSFNLTMTGIKSKWIITGHVKDDKWIVEQYRAIPTITTLKVYTSGMVDSEELEKLINDFSNEYWPILYRAMAPMIIDTWEPWCIDKANKLFSKVSFSKVFPK